MGTALQAMNLSARDFGGADLEGCNENLNLTRPEVIQEVLETYLDAGADIVETNTFGATPLVLGEYDLSTKAIEINVRAAQIARAAADKYSTSARPRFVAGSMGPTTKAMSVIGGITFDELTDHYEVQAKALLEGGVDYLLLETCQDTRNIKAAFCAIDRVFENSRREIPVAVSATIEAMGTMLAGQSVEALAAALGHRKLLYLGLNCATGPAFMTDHLRSLAAQAPFRISCVPNAGLPDSNGTYLETPEMVASVVQRFLEQGWLNVIGGCCGTTAAHIRALSQVAQAHTPRAVPPAALRKSLLSGIDPLEIDEGTRPILVGERTNVIGSKKFKETIIAGDLEKAVEVARAQIKGGAHLIDICLANPDRNELDDTRTFLAKVMPRIRCPIMIDSTDAKVIEEALKYCQGKAIINSINLEDGEERFDHVLPLAKRYGAALVVGTIDDDPVAGMGVTRARKLEIARREYQLLTERWGIPASDIYWDPLVFPCATGDAQYVGSAVETIEGIRILKEAFPGTKTVLGISNVSFGLPPAGREVLNSVFMYHCVQAGLDLAIVNSEKLLRYPQIPEEEKKLSEDLLWNRGTDPVAAFAAYFRGRAGQGPKVDNRRSLPLDERLAQAIVQGSQEGLTEDLAEAMTSRPPLEIINGPLMKGMDEVGRLFNENKLIVAEVLQSAEVMKAAVSFLEPHMSKAASSSRGKVILATVKGDVHDIGKNLVQIILSNNGFEVVDLGIKVPPEQLLKAVKEHAPHMIGLSGLLVKSAHQMVVTAEDLRTAGVDVPILVGGAALSETFVDREISRAYGNGTVAYAGDAMSGLDLAKTLMHPEKSAALRDTLSQRRQNLAERRAAPAVAAASTQRSTSIELIATPPRPPDFDRHVLRDTPIEMIWKYINPLMLYGRHLGLPGASVRNLSRDPKGKELQEVVRAVQTEYGPEVFRPVGVYRFFEARPDGNAIVLKDARFEFERQRKPDGLCLSDYLSPKDSIALFVVSVGQGIRQLSESLKARGKFVWSHVVQALAIESAEAYAELLHEMLRRAWGFPDSAALTLTEKFQAKYRGKRYSFGYPACPRLEDQRILFDLLQPQEIGVQLTEGMMMDPEASVSAIVFHHPQASYFGVGATRE